MPGDFPAYYAVLTADVRYDTKLCANAKILYAEITALLGPEGYAWPSNNYFSRLYDVTPSTVSEWVKQLVDRGYVTLSMQKTPTGWRRLIRVSEGGVFGKNRGGSSGKAEEGSSGKPEENNLTLTTPTDHSLVVPPAPPPLMLLRDGENPKAKKAKEIRAFTDYYQGLFMHDYAGAKPTWDGKIMKLVKADIARLGGALLQELAWLFFEYPPAFVQERETGMGYNVFHGMIDSLLERKRRHDDNGARENQG